MTTQIILSKLTNLVIPDEIIFDIDKMVYHVKHALNHKKIMDELYSFRCPEWDFKNYKLGDLNMGTYILARIDGMPQLEWEILGDYIVNRV